MNSCTVNLYVFLFFQISFLTNLQGTYFFEDFTGTQKVLLRQIYTLYFDHKVHKAFYIWLCELCVLMVKLDVRKITVSDPYNEKTLQ